jgi:hypothetical protein
MKVKTLIALLHEPESDGGAPSDVFIAEGRQLRYGSKDIWDVASRG